MEQQSELGGDGQGPESKEVWKAGELNKVDWNFEQGWVKFQKIAGHSLERRECCG